ncbi:MAG TPA: SPFH domain-containing protein [Pirellulales bacterium]|nr:SPFH domain-containing protein [Pirellulales bacterium]
MSSHISFAPLLFAATSPLFWLAAIAIAVMIVFFGVVIPLASRYKRCPSNRVLVIYGKSGAGEVSRCIHGGAAFVVPLIQDYAWLSLEPIQIEIPLRGALSAENIRVNVPSVFTVAVGTSLEVMQNAAIRLLGLNTVQVKEQAEEIIFGQLRQVIASMRIEDINRDRDTFLEHIQRSLEPELKKVGLVLINVNITDITDESGYIDAIGQKAASQAIQQARGDVAEQEKLGETRVAEAERDKVVQVASATKLREIGTREAQREQAVRLAELAKEQAIGEQTAAFLREAQVKDAERTMRIALADANAKAVTGENSAQAEIAASQAELQVKKADAYALGETRKREAEAVVLEAQNRAMAKAALAEAERVEAERRAAVEAPAKAEKAKVIVQAEAEAEKRRIEAVGEASAIYAKLEAEARGQYEILAKKGEGLREIISACGGAQQAFQMLMLEHLDQLAAASAEAISKIKFDKVVVWENGGQNGTTNTASFLHGMARTMPPMMQVLRDIGGVEIPDSLVKFGQNEPVTTSGNGSAGSHSSAEAEPTVKTGA